jgi:hypothetical protein
MLAQLLEFALGLVLSKYADSPNRATIGKSLEYAEVAQHRALFRDRNSILNIGMPLIFWNILPRNLKRKSYPQIIHSPQYSADMLDHLPSSRPPQKFPEDASFRITVSRA